MKNKISLSMICLLMVALGIMMLITNGKRVQIKQVRKEVSQVNKQQKQVTTQIDNLQTTYNASDAIAKSKLLAFAKVYYTFSNQADYNQRFSQVSDILSLSDDQKNQLFDSGLDETGGSRIDNLGLTSRYQTATSYTSDLDNQTIEVLATVIVETSGTGQKSTNQTVLLHGWFYIQTQQFTSIKINQIQ
ncbi:VirB8/TrbF family protein [Leuconostoc citreum]|uniref:VirB8/TrbF family protein n=1 Tax=Leuconostoc citreum TaxID=33964 RepID=UPI00209E8389|nr:VirB8/TrbF family protein [Leuconostoc citreum]MCP1275651.1 VirB8/TrbF family protein [Leuconostoc citreum]